MFFHDAQYWKKVKVWIKKRECLGDNDQNYDDNEDKYIKNISKDHYKKRNSIINWVQHYHHALLGRKTWLINLEEKFSLYLLAGGWAWLTQLRFTYDPSLMSPGGVTSTRVFFGESKQANRHHMPLEQLLIGYGFYWRQCWSLPNVLCWR